MTLITANQVRDLLRTACAKAGSQREFARQHGLSSGQISEILIGRRQPTPAVLGPLGLRQHERLYAPAPVWPPEEAYDPNLLSREENL